MLSNLGRSLFSQWVYSCTSPLAIASFTHVPALNKQAVFISKGHGFKRSSTQLDTISLQVPPIGESILKGTVAFVLKPGIQFGVDDLVAQVKTDKDTVDVLAHVPGAFEKVEVQEGDTVMVGQVIGVVEAKGDWLPHQASAQVSPFEIAIESSGRTPGIKFPPRRSADGELLSSRIVSVEGGPSESTLIGTVFAEGFSSSGYITQIPPPKLHVDITEDEMESVMLGGADP